MCIRDRYDGLDNLPPIPAGYGVSGLDPNIPVTNQGDTPKSKLNPGKIIYTKDLIFKGGSHGSTLSIIPEEKAKEMADKLPKVPKSPSNHFENFLLACNGIEKTRSPDVYKRQLMPHTRVNIHRESQIFPQGEIIT